MKQTGVTRGFMNSYRMVNETREKLAGTDYTALYEAATQAEIALLRGLSKVDSKRDWGLIADSLGR